MNATLSRRMAAPLTLHAQTAADLMMSNPISLRAEAGVAEAITLFTEKGIAAAPVIDQAGHPIGVISRSDLLVHQREHDRNPHTQHDFFSAGAFEMAEEGEPRTGTVTVADLMTPAVFAVSPDTPVDRVINDMVGLHVHRLFVVDEDGILVGVISAMDVIRRLQPED